MKLTLSAAAALIFATATTAQPPAIGQNGVVNEASQIPPTLPGGALARGALVDVAGVRLSSGSRNSPTSAYVIQGSTRVAARVFETSPQKLQLLIPFDAPLGAATLVISVNGRNSRPFPVEIAGFNPGLYSMNGAGWGQGRIENIDHSGKATENSITNPARPGEMIAVDGTGMGEAREIEVVVGDRRLKVPGAHTGSRDGEDVLRFAIPADAPRGCWVPVYVMAAPRRASNVVTMAIASEGPANEHKPGGARCDPRPVPLETGKNVFTVVLSRIERKPAVAGRNDSVDDEARIAVRGASQTPVFSRNNLVPPPGTCRSYTSSYQADEEPTISLSNLIEPGGAGLDLGTKLVLTRGSQSRDISELPNEAGDYRTRLGLSGFTTNNRMPPPFLAPGQFLLKVPGGAGGKAFSITINIAQPFRWVDRDQITSVERSRGITVHWRNAPSNALMVIAAKNVDQFTTAIGACLCTSRANAGQFTIPAEILANIPISRGAAGERNDELLVGALVWGPIPAKDLAGFGAGAVFSAYGEARYVDFK